LDDEIQAEAVHLDLLGDPVDAAFAHIGAPQFEINNENQYLVTVLGAAGWVQNRIARHIGCDPKTLRKHFSRELDRATDMIEAAALATIAGRMAEGNVSAANKMLLAIANGHAAVLLNPAARLPRAEQMAADVTEVEALSAGKPLGEKSSRARGSGQTGGGVGWASQLMAYDSARPRWVAA
jgi:hypothetical protein